MNAHLGGSWGGEERIRYPSGTGPYTATIVVTAEGYEVHEGGEVRHVFRHRSPWTRFEAASADAAWEVVVEDANKNDARA